MKVKVYSLAINDESLVEVEVEAPRWLPVRPSLNRRWLSSVVAQAVRGYFARHASEPAELLMTAARS